MLYSHAIRHLAVLFCRVFLFHILEWIKIFRVSKIFSRASEKLTGLKSGSQAPGEGLESGQEPQAFAPHSTGPTEMAPQRFPSTLGGFSTPLASPHQQGPVGDARPAQQKVLRGHWNANFSS